MMTTEKKEKQGDYCSTSFLSISPNRTFSVIQPLSLSSSASNLSMKAAILVGGAQKAKNYYVACWRSSHFNLRFVSHFAGFDTRICSSTVSNEALNFSNGTRFRPLSLQLPKPLFPIAGVPLIEHHISQLCEFDQLTEIYLIGAYPADQFDEFVKDCTRKYRIPVDYLQEDPKYDAAMGLGTAGALLAFRDILLQGSPAALFVLNADVCGDLPLGEMVDELADRGESAECLILTTEATRDQSVNYGCVVIDSQDTTHPRGPVIHYVNKPSSFLSTHISCGIYLMRPLFWSRLERCALNDNGNNSKHEIHSIGFQKLQNGQFVPNSIAKSESDQEKELSNRVASKNKPKMNNCYGNGNGSCNGHQLWLETDVFPQMAPTNTLFAIHTTRWWSQTKTAGAVLYANRHYLRLYRERGPPRGLLTGFVCCCDVEGDVYVDPTAKVHPTARLGPNASIGARAQIGAGVRVRESIVLPDCILEEHSCILHSVIGWRSYIGAWSRVEGTPIEPNPNVPFAKLDNKPLFNLDGRLNPALTILGSDVCVYAETVVLNSVVLPYKELQSNCKNQIIL